MAFGEQSWLGRQDLCGGMPAIALHSRGIVVELRLASWVQPSAQTVFAQAAELSGSSWLCRWGTDVLKALALGADAVLLGRPCMWGLALQGQAGVEKVLSLLRRQLELAMVLAGVPNLQSITRDLVIQLSKL